MPGVARYIPGLALALAIGSAADGEVPSRRLNDGMLVLEDIPGLPASLAADLNRHQN